MIKRFLLVLASCSLMGWICKESIKPAWGAPVVAPNFNQINLNSLGTIQKSGSLSIPSNIVSILGYNPSRSWQAGQNVSQVMQLGDFQSSFQLHNLTLKDIGQATNANINSLSLASFGLINFQTLEDLARAVPGLSQTNVTNIRPVFDLLSQLGLGNNFHQNPTLGQVLNSKPELKAMKLKNLQRYRIADIPRLKDTQLFKFRAWQRSAIASIPFLDRVPFNRFPQPPYNNIVSVAIANIFLGQEEQGNPSLNDALFVSGSARSGNTIPVKCPSGASCSHVELSHPTLTDNHGKRWVSGSQLVPGGEGLLATVNGGKEPTGRLVFGDVFKVVLTHVDESNSIANFGLYFRMCERAPIDLGCTPYLIGPFPWIPVGVNQPIVLKANP